MKSPSPSSQKKAKDMGRRVLWSALCTCCILLALLAIGTTAEPTTAYHHILALTSTQSLLSEGLPVYDSSSTDEEAKDPGGESFPPARDTPLKCFAVVGKRKVGKTFFLNKLLPGVGLPSGNRFRTLGLSVYYKFVKTQWVAFVDVGNADDADDFATESALQDAIVNLGCQVLLIVSDPTTAHDEVTAMEERIMSVRGVEAAANYKNEKQRSVFAALQPVHDTLAVLLNLQKVNSALDLISGLRLLTRNAATSQPSLIRSPCDEKAKVQSSSVLAEALQFDLVRATAMSTKRKLGTFHTVETARYVLGEDNTEAGLLLNEVTMCHLLSTVFGGGKARNFGEFENALQSSLLWALSRYLTNDGGSSLSALNFSSEIPAVRSSNPDQTSSIKRSVPQEKSSESKLEGDESTASIRPLAQACLRTPGFVESISYSEKVRSNYPVLHRLIQVQSWLWEVPKGVCQRHVRTLRLSPPVREAPSTWLPRVHVSLYEDSDGLDVVVVRLTSTGCVLGSNANLTVSQQQSLGNEVVFVCHRPGNDITRVPITFVKPAARYCGLNGEFGGDTPRTPLRGGGSKIRAV